MNDAAVGGRPLVYKQGAGEATVIDNKTGAVIKREDAAQAAANTASSSTSAPSNDKVLSGVARPQWAVEQQNTQNERVAQNARAAPQAAPAGPAPAVSDSGASGSYTQVTRYGDMLFISGQIGFDGRGANPGLDPTIEGQTRLAMEQIRGLLESNRMTMANLVSVTVFLANINNLGAVDRVYSSFFKSALPSRSVVEVAKLPRGALIEISAIAGK